MHVCSVVRLIGVRSSGAKTIILRRRTVSLYASPCHRWPASSWWARMSDAGSNLSYQSPSTSPRLGAEWTFDAQGERGQLPLMEVNESEKPTSNGMVVGEELLENALPSQQDKSDAPLRGRTNRKRSNAQQIYVCVVVWLVKPVKGDEESERIWNNVQEVRRRYDQAYSRWTPHVTLIPPFIVPFQRKTHVVADRSEDRNVDVSEEDGSGSGSSTSLSVTKSDVRQISNGKAVMRILSKRIASICQRFAAQSLQFDEVSKFALRRYDTYHLRPSANAEGTLMLTRLQEELALHLPEAVEYSRTSSISAKFRRRQSYLKQQQQQQQQQQHARKTSNELVGTTSEPLASGLPGSNVVGAIKNGVDQRAPSIKSPAQSPVIAGEITFKPHLTLGQASQREKAEEIQRFAEDLITPTRASGDQGLLRVTLDSIQLMWKPVHQSGPYDLFQSFSLSSPQADKLV